MQCHSFDFDRAHGCCLLLNHLTQSQYISGVWMVMNFIQLHIQGKYAQSKALLTQYNIRCPQIEVMFLSLRLGPHLCGWHSPLLCGHCSLFSEWAAVPAGNAGKRFLQLFKTIASRKSHGAFAPCTFLHPQTHCMFRCVGIRLGMNGRHMRL